MSDDISSPTVHIGTSGWNYPEWRGKFYPAGLAKTRELEYVSHQFDTLEINSSFYRLMRASTYEKWANGTPDHFLYSVKGWRGITHFKKLVNATENLAMFFDSGVLALGTKLGPILWQLPPSLGFNAEVLESFLASLPRTVGEARTLGATAPPPPSKASAAATASDSSASVPTPAPVQSSLLAPEPSPFVAADDQPLRYAVEPRSAGFDSPEALAIFEKHNVALVMADIAGRYPQFREVTADLVYVRLHGSPRVYYSNYSEAALEEWAARIKQWRSEGRDTFFYFDNTAAGWAPVNAHQLIEMVGGEPE